MNPRRIFVALLVLCAGFTARAQYQNGSVVTVLPGGTNNVAATATNTLASDIVVARSDGAGVFLSAKALAAHTGDVIFVFKRGVDSAAVESAETFRITLVAAGTATVNLYTNLAIGHEQFIRLTAIENATGVAVTNVVVKVALKR